MVKMFRSLLPLLLVLGGCADTPNPEAVRLCRQLRDATPETRLEICASQNEQMIKAFICQALPRHTDESPRRVEFVYVIRSFDSSHQEQCRVY